VPFTKQPTKLEAVSHRQIVTGVVLPMALLWLTSPAALSAEASKFEVAGPISLAHNQNVLQDVLVAPSLPPPPQLEGSVKASVKEKDSKQCKFVTVPIFYATNRLPENNKDLAYGKQRGPRLEFGECEVTCPFSDDDDRSSSYLLTHEWKLSSQGQSHAVGAPKRFAGSDEMVAAIKRVQAQTGDKRLIVFVHGYAASFNKASRFGANLAYGSGIPVLVFSWPTQHNPIIYSADECNAEWTYPRFQQFLRFLNGKFEARNITLVSHSMGARIVSWALQATRDQSGADLDASERYQHVFFCCPDIDRDTFAIYADRIKNSSNDTVVFVSGNDFRLGLSELLHGHARLGEFNNHRKEVRSIPGVETVDFTAIDPGFGHSMPYPLLFQILNHDLLPPGIALVKRNYEQGDGSILEVVKVAKRH